MQGKYWPKRLLMAYQLTELSPLQGKYLSLSSSFLKFYRIIPIAGEILLSNPGSVTGFQNYPHCRGNTAVFFEWLSPNSELSPLQGKYRLFVLHQLFRLWNYPHCRGNTPSQWPLYLSFRIIPIAGEIPIQGCKPDCLIWNYPHCRGNTNIPPQPRFGPRNYPHCRGNTLV